MIDQFEIEFLFEDEPHGAVMDLLREAGAEQIAYKNEVGFSGGEVILAVLAAELMTNVVIKLSRLWNCGIIVDARGSKVKTKKDCGLPRGAVLIISSKGMQVELKEPTELNLDPLLVRALKPDKS